MQAADASWYPRHAHTYTNTHTRTRTQEHSGRNRKWLPKRREMSRPLRQTAFRAGSPHRKLVAPEEGSALAAIVIVQHSAQSQCTPPPPQHTHTHHYHLPHHHTHNPPDPSALCWCRRRWTPFAVQTSVKRSIWCLSCSVNFVQRVAQLIKALKNCHNLLMQIHPLTLKSSIISQATGVDKPRVGR